MANAAILSPHLSDAATLTVSSEVSTLPGTHLQTPNAWQLWRAASNDEQIILDFGSAVAFNALCLVGLNHTTAAQWRIKVADSVAGLTSSPTVVLNWTVIDAGAAPDPTLFPNRRTYLSFNAVTKRALSIEVDDGTNPDPLEAWRVIVGTLFQPTGGIDHELARPIDSVDVQEARFAGGRVGGARGRARGASFQWSALTRAEADTLQDIAIRRGNWGDVLFLLDPADATRRQRDSVLGPFAPGYPDIVDVPLWPGDGLDLQMSRAAVRVFEGNA